MSKVKCESGWELQFCHVYSQQPAQLWAKFPESTITTLTRDSSGRQVQISSPEESHRDYSLTKIGIVDSAVMTLSDRNCTCKNIANST
jgi:hypothetical protein